VKCILYKTNLVDQEFFGSQYVAHANFSRNNYDRMTEENGTLTFSTYHHL